MKSNPVAKKITGYLYNILVIGSMLAYVFHPTSVTHGLGLGFLWLDTLVTFVYLLSIVAGVVGVYVSIRTKRTENIPDTDYDKLLKTKAEYNIYRSGIILMLTAAAGFACGFIVLTLLNAFLTIGVLLGAYMFTSGLIEAIEISRAKKGF